MAVYDADGNRLSAVYDADGNSLQNAYDADGNLIFTRGYQTKQTYLGGYIEIQPDSWDGSTPVTGTIVAPTDSTAWGFPMSLSSASKTAIKADILNGSTGVRYIRFPLGFAYRGYRNIDSTTGLAKNIGERWSGQNSALHDWFTSIAQAGGGLAPEYWCPAPYWLTTGSYSGTNNQLRAGGSYSQATTLASIKSSDPTQYNAQIDAFTDAVMDDLVYLHENIAPVVMFGLQNEPQYGSTEYGACKWDAQTYNDVLTALYPKLIAEFPNIKLHVASSDESSPFGGIGYTFIANHADWIWGYSHHKMRYISGEQYEGGADWYKTSAFQTMKGTKENVFCNEYEYFNTSFGTDDFRCSNNMVHLINELVYGEAEVLHPIIHICKPTGQSSVDTNTRGYCLYAVDMTDGSYSVNTWAYNSWKMFNDNLPIGAQIISDFDVVDENVGFMACVNDGKLILLMANKSDSIKSITIDFGESKSFSGKLYSMTALGTAQQSVSDRSITFTIPAYSGLVYIEN